MFILLAQNTEEYRGNTSKNKFFPLAHNTTEPIPNNPNQTYHRVEKKNKRQIILVLLVNNQLSTV